jgi:hypothetical protein
MDFTPPPAPGHVVGTGRISATSATSSRRSSGGHRTQGRPARRHVRVTIPGRRRGRAAGDAGGICSGAAPARIHLERQRPRRGDSARRARRGPCCAWRARESAA